MSEKRRRQQARRQRRQAHGAARTRRSETDRLLEELARLAADDAPEVADALEAEQWASHLIGTWHRAAVPGDDIDAVFLPGFVAALEALHTASALAALVPAQPTGALLIYEETFDDGVSVLVEFGSHTLGVYIDHNLGGLVKDAFIAGPLPEVRELLTAPQVSVRELDLAEARARIEAAFSELDHTLDPPVGEDVAGLGALVEARMRVLPAGFALPDADREMTPEEREQLLAGFLASPEGLRWRGDEDAEDAAMLAIDFGAGYNHGGPLRWSPVVVELFMLDWLACKVTREPDFFERLADVLQDWVRYAGRRRALPAEAVIQVADAVAEHRSEMLETVSDPAAWGPAKVLATAALEAEVDM